MIKDKVSWEEKNKNKIAWFCGHTRGYVCECDKLKDFIRSLLKEERVRVIEEVGEEIKKAIKRNTDDFGQTDYDQLGTFVIGLHEILKFKLSKEREV